MSLAKTFDHLDFDQNFRNVDFGQNFSKISMFVSIFGNYLDFSKKKKKLQISKLV